MTHREVRFDEGHESARLCIAQARMSGESLNDALSHVLATAVRTWNGAEVTLKRGTAPDDPIVASATVAGLDNFDRHLAQYGLMLGNHHQ